MSSFFNLYGQSPHSSSGAVESSEGTPDTRLTSFSPEDSRPIKASNGSSAGTPLRAGPQDPFVTTATKTKGEQKLSATASAFQPFGLKVASASSTPAIAYGSSATAALPGKIQQLDNILAGLKNTPSKTAPAPQQEDLTQYGSFSTDTGVTRCIQIKSISTGDVLPSVTTSLEKLRKTGFSLKGTQRMGARGNSAVYLRYSNLLEASTVHTALKQDLNEYGVEYISPATFASAVQSPTKCSYSAHEGQVVLTASYPAGAVYNKKEFEESLRAFLSAEAKLVAWQKLAATEAGTFRMVAEFFDSALAVRAAQRCHGHEIPVSIASGDRHTVKLSVEMHTPDITAAQPPHRLEAMATPTRRSAEQSDLGDALGRMSLNQNQSPGLPGNSGMFATPVAASAGVHFMPTNTASFALPLNTLPVLMGGMYSPAHIAFQQGYTPSVHHQGPLGGNNFSDFAPATYNQQAYVHGGFDRYGFSLPGFQQNNYSQEYGYYGSQSPSHSRETNFFNRPSGRRQNAAKVPHSSMRGRHFPNPTAGHHNHVDVHRIRQGIDVRTTVMLRNIPNKVDQAMLKEIIDESSFGRYDFMYLRIDFSNDCNVGYAFINFTDPLDITDFVVARSNQKWHRFKSDKVAEVSYATIQGRDCLIQKFRNSSVMLEPPHYRPKLFLTIHDPFGRAGEEDQFPASDNASKLKRSCENAEHVGLFAPSAGQHLRDEQRRRRSQYDRGTSLAEREEYGFEDGSIHAPYHGYPPY